LSAYCTGCHGGKSPRAGLDLKKLVDEEPPVRSPKFWAQLKDYVAAGDMPPEGKAQPRQDETKRFILWVDEAGARLDCKNLSDPGRVTLRRLNRVEYRNTIRDLVGIEFSGAEDFPSDDVGYGFDNIGDVLTLPPLLFEKYLSAAETIAAQAITRDLALSEGQRRVLVRMPKAGEDRDEVAREVLRRFGTRAFRRPIAAGEVARLAKLAEVADQNGEPFERGIELAVRAALVSPHFLFRVETTGRRREPKKGESQDSTGYPINEFALAARLSYFLWSTMPDDELFRLAGASQLREGDALQRQVRRMLADPKARALSENFFGQWLQLRNLRTATPDRGRFPTFDEPLRSAMARETELFVEAIIKEDRSLLDLIDANFTFVNGRLAKHYGLTAVEGDKFQRVTLEGGRRGGVITQASVLTVTSNPTRTSPVKRGKWILEQILGTPPPPPPAKVPELDNQPSLTGTLRQKMEQHRSNAACASCHARMDPLGFGLENYDAVGAWRDSDGGEPIDASGEFPAGPSFGGPAELKAILKGRSLDFTRCLAEKLLTYALGRGLQERDACAIDSIVKATAKDGFKFSRLVLEIVRSEPFQKRKGRG
jgi:hypothetical protein